MKTELDLAGGLDRPMKMKAAAHVDIRVCVTLKENFLGGPHLLPHFKKHF